MSNPFDVSLPHLLSQLGLKKVNICDLEVEGVNEQKIYAGHKLASIIQSSSASFVLLFVLEMNRKSTAKAFMTPRAIVAWTIV